jgi:hypothetical protein
VTNIAARPVTMPGRRAPRLALPALELLGPRPERSVGPIAAVEEAETQPEQAQAR